MWKKKKNGEYNLIKKTNKADFSQFFTATHTCIFYGGDTGHTHKRRPEVAVKCTRRISPIPDRPSSSTPPGAVGSFSAPGDQVNRPSRSWTDRRMFCFCMFFLLGFLLEETPCEHGEISPPE